MPSQSEEGAIIMLVIESQEQFGRRCKMVGLQRLMESRQEEGCL